MASSLLELVAQHPLAATLVGLALSVLAYGLRPLLVYSLSSIPGPRPAWAVGSLPEFTAKSNWDGFYEWHQRYGPVFQYWLGAQRIVVVAEPELARSLHLRLNARHPVPGPTHLLSRKLRQCDAIGLFQQTNREAHRSMRQVWSPAMLGQSLEGYAALMNTCAERMTAQLAKAAKEGQVLDIYDLMGTLTFDTVGTAAFGVEFRTQDAGPGGSDEATQLTSAVQTVFRLMNPSSSIYTGLAVLFPFLTPLLRVMVAVAPDRGMREYRDAYEKVFRITEGLLESSSAAKAQGDKAAAETPLNGKAPAKRRTALAPGSFLPHLQASHLQTPQGERPLTNGEMAQQAFQFLVAAFETTGTALAMTIYLLTTNPDKLDKLLQEVDGFGRQRVPSYEDVDTRLPYIAACLKEALRLYPPGPVTLREAAQDLDVGGHRVPAGTWVQGAVGTIHRDAAVWRDVERFIPERWLEGDPLEASPAEARAHMAFGDGARSCVGKRFALAEARITLTRIFQQFTFRLEPGQDPPLKCLAYFTLRPVHGIKMTPVLRD